MARRRVLVESVGDGRYRLLLDDDERATLAALADTLRDILMAEDTVAAERLFPPAYADNEDHQSDYQALMGDQLLAQRFDALDTLDEVSGSDSFGSEQMEAWMTALNCLRLVIGSRLDLEEDDDGTWDPSAPDAVDRVAYHWLTILLGDSVAAVDLG